MHLKTLPLLSFIFITSCSQPENNERPTLTDEQKSEIAEYSNELVNSINNFDFSVINETWSNEAFKQRFTNLTSAQKSVFDHIFEEDIKRTIKVRNLSIIHTVNETNGSVELFDLEHFDNYSELTLLLTFDGWFNFFKYRIEHRGNPVICDFYQFTDDLWYSEKMLNALKMNSKYDAFSNQRHQANQAINDHQQFLIRGDTLSALMSLYEVPKTHESGNWLSLKKLNLAANIDDSTYFEVLTQEYQNNGSLYLKYLYNYYTQDSVNLNEIYQLLASELGNSETLDSLVNAGSFWN